MKHQILLPSLALGMSLCMCFLAGCKKGNETGGEAGATSAPGSASSPGSAATSDWPSDLPKFQGGQLAQINRGDGNKGFQGAIYSQIKNPEKTFGQYKATLEGKGWTLDEDTSNPVTWSALFVKGTQDVHVSVSKDGLIANLMYSPD